MPDIGLWPALLWWAGLVLVVLVVLPAVVWLAHGITRTALEVRAYARDVDEHAARAHDALAGLDELRRTRELTAQLRASVDRFGARLTGAAGTQPGSGT